MASNTNNGGVGMSQEGKEKCPNCGKEFFHETRDHPGYGAGEGTVTEYRKLCPICKRGCYLGNDDDIPGFSEIDESDCCYCESTREDREKYYR